MKKFYVLLMVISMMVILAACSAPIATLPGEVPLTDAQSFLSFLTDPAGGGWIIVSFFIAWMAEYWKAWHSFKPWIKQTTMLMLAALVAAGAQWLLASPEAYTLVEPYLTPALKFIAFALTMQTAHRLDKGSNGTTVGKEVSLK